MPPEPSRHNGKCAVVPNHLEQARTANMTGNYRPRRITLRDGREVTVRAVVEADATEIVQAFDRLSASSRYSRFMMHKKRPAWLSVAVVASASDAEAMRSCAESGRGRFA